MIQRIQSIFLLIAAIIPIVLLFLPFGYVDTLSAQYIYNAVCLKFNIPDGHAVIRLYYIAFCLVLCSALSLVALFSYKKRTRQVQVVSITMIVYLITLLLMLWVCPDIIFKNFFQTKGEVMTGFTFAHKAVLLVLIFVEAISLFLSNKFIKRDEALVRTADRLR